MRSDPQAFRNRSLTALLVLQVLVLFVAAPIAGMGPQAPFLGGAVIVGGLMASVILATPGTGSKILAAVAFGLSVAGILARLRYPSQITIWFGHCAVITAVLAISLVVGKVVFAPGRITYHRIEGAVVLYLNIAIVFTSAYRLVVQLSPHSFTNVPAELNEAAAMDIMLYFSFTTLTSTGFGEIVPLHPFARSLTNLEAVLGQLYLAILLARLVSLHAGTGRKRSP